MPPKSRYPLQALLHHRTELRDDSAQRLASRIRDDEQAQRTRRSAEAAEDSHRDAVDRAVQAECGRTDEGLASVQDLLTLQAWEIAQQAVASALRAQTDEAQEQARQASTHLAGARSDLAVAQAQADAVRQDRDKFFDRLRRREEARDDENAEEAHAGRAFLDRRIRGG